MASVHYICHDAENLERELVQRYIQQEKDGERRHMSSVMIQKTWRSYTVRKMVKNWHKSATIIQKNVRGWLVRWHLPDILKQHLDLMSKLFYNQEATKIQALWRGYQVRKVVCMRTLIDERACLAMLNSKMQEALREQLRKTRGTIKVNGVEVENVWLKKCLYTLCNRHHLLRTHQREGVLSCHGTKSLSELEQLLKAIPCKDYVKKKRKICNSHKHEKKVTVKSDKQGRLVHPKPFDLNPKIPKAPYERLLMLQS